VDKYELDINTYTQTIKFWQEKNICVNF